MFDGTEQVLRPGVVRKLVGTSGGTPASFSCAGGSYPIVKTATRTIWRCSQTLSAFMRFPCGGKGAAAGCTVDYNAAWWVGWQTCGVVVEDFHSIYGPAVCARDRTMAAATLYLPCLPRCHGL
jgi:hypothetical protein